MKVRLCVALLALMVVMLPLSLVAAPGAAPADARRAAAAHINNLPLSFEPQALPGHYLARSGRYAMLIGATESSVVVSDAKSDSYSMLRFGFENANRAASLEALDPLPGVTNYYMGNDRRNWRLGVKNFARLRATSVYPGVDVVYYGDQRRLEFDFVVAPQADPAAIALTFSGADKLYSVDGDLVAEVNGHPVRFAKPFAYQQVAGNKEPVNVAYVLDGAGKAKLQVGSYDKSLELVIDPVVTYATYLGGSQKDEVDGIAIDGSGNAYVTGQTCSPDFLSPSKPVVKCSAYVSEISADGSALVGSTAVIGGDNNTWGRSITLDSTGTVYVAGGTNSTNLASNTTITRHGVGTQPNSYFGGDSDAFIAVVSGGTLQRLAYLGGSGADDGFGVAIDSATPPNVIATGETCYPTGLGARPDFPAYSGFQRKVEFCVAFITKLDNALDIYVQDPLNDSWGDAPSGGTFYFSEYFGGQPSNVPSDIWRANHQYYKGDVISITYRDSSGNLVSKAERCNVTGTTGPSQPEWSSTTNSLTGDNTITWQNMGDPGTLVNATTISRAISVDPLGDVFVAGGSDSGFIGCDICGDTSYFQGSGAWVAKVNKDGGWVYSTVLGTIKTDTANAIAVDGSGQAYIAGTSTGGIFIPANTTSFQSKNGGGQDAFIIQLDNAGTNINYASYLGGSGDDQALGVAVDVNGAAYVVGSTKSAKFPTVNPLTNPKTNLAMDALSGQEDAFVARFIPGGSAVAFSTYLGGSNADQARAVTVEQNGRNVFVAGFTHSWDFPVYQSDTNTAVLQADYNPGSDNDAGDGFVAKIPIATLPNIAINPSPKDGLAFTEPQNVGTTSPAQSVTFTNTGNSPITITKIEVTGDFAQTNNCPGTALLTNASCTVQVTFTPTSAGGKTGTLSFYDNGNGSPQSISLSGSGTTLNSGSPVSVSPSSLSFGDQAQTTTSAAKTITLTNITTDSVVVTTSTSITGANSSEFAQTATTCSSPLGAAGTSTASCTFSFTFTPAGTGDRTATVTITVGTSSVPVVLTGNGTAAPTPDFTVGSDSSGLSVAAGGTKNFQVTIAPVGGFSQTVALSCSVPSPASCTVAPTSVTLSGTASSTATVTVSVPAPSSGGGTKTAGNFRWAGPFGALPFCAALTLIGCRRRRWLILALVVLGLALVLSGCGGGGSGSSGMQPGSYSVTVTATYGGTTPVTHTATVPLTVTK